jgi:hypothetical protein
VRTTLTLDSDVAEKLKAESRRSGQSFKATVNEALRRGLARKSIRKTPKFQVRDIGFRLGAHFESTSLFLDQLDGI